MTLYLANQLGDVVSRTLFRDLNMITSKEYETNNTRIPSYVNTYQNIPTFQITENLSRNYARSGQQKYADVYGNRYGENKRPIDLKYDGRNLHMLKTLEYNKRRDYPDVITKDPLKVVGYYR